jgi:hypothetical protein
LFHCEKYYELKEPLQQLLEPYNFKVESFSNYLIYDNIVHTDSDFKILGTLITVELKIKEVLVIQIPNSTEILNRIKDEFNNIFVGYVEDNYDKIHAKKYYSAKLKYKSIRQLKSAIKLQLHKVVPDFYSRHGWNTDSVDEINKIATDSLSQIHDYFNIIKIELKKELDAYKKVKLVRS